MLFIKQKTAYELSLSVLGSEMCIRETGRPVTDPSAGQPINIAPSSGAPAPIVPPAQSPTTRGQYSDPYAPGAAPPPCSNGNSVGLQTVPLPPVANN